jgi:bacterioferritin-associated ferredoxin
MYLCSCRAINDSHVRELGRAGVCAAEDLIEVLGLNQPGCCGRCQRRIDRFVAVAALEYGGAGVTHSTPA